MHPSHNLRQLGSGDRLYIRSIAITAIYLTIRTVISNSTVPTVLDHLDSRNQGNYYITATAGARACMRSDGRHWTESTEISVVRAQMSISALCRPSMNLMRLRYDGGEYSTERSHTVVQTKRLIRER